MRFQQFILGKRNQIAIVSGLIIAFAFIAQYGFNSETTFEISLIIASILGVLPIAIQAYHSARIKVVSIDILVTIAVVGAFLIQNFEESAIVTFLFLFGGLLEQRTLQSTRSAIQELTAMAPETALKLMENDQFEEVDIWDVDEGDILLVRTGANIPVDGQVVSGEGYVNEASITGEAEQIRKTDGLKVFAGTTLENGTLQIQADRVGEDTTFGKIIELVEDAQDSKSEAERFIDQFSKYYTPIVLVLGILVWAFTRDIELAITVLVLGCPGALVIGVPVSNVAGIGNGARNGTLLKGSEVIQDFSHVDTIIFDKTGTLTRGEPEVGEVINYTTGDDLSLAYQYAASVEAESDHPLAHALVEHIGDVPYHPVSETNVVKGAGIIAQVNQQPIAIGNAGLMTQLNIPMTEQMQQDADDFEKRGNSIVMIAVDGELKALLGIRDQIRQDVHENLQRFRKIGVQNLIVLSGDNQGTVDVIAEELGLTKAKGEMLPEDKAAYLQQLQADGHTVAFVGDGVNDSPSLALADVGIAMGSGTDVAIETSDVVLVNSDFDHLVHALGLTKAIRANIIQNIVIAVGTVIFLLFALFFSDWLNMAIGMLVHEGSILLVIVNGMRLLRFRNKV